MSVRAVAAVDLGATSGRVMIGRVGADSLELELVTRFPHGPEQRADGLHWNFAALMEHILEGLTAAIQREPAIESIGVDSWGVDYGMLHAGRLLADPFHYRDERTLPAVEKVHATLSKAELYARNGLQFMPINTIYQLVAERLLDDADTALLIPDLVGHVLTGKSYAEQTIASTTGLLDVRSGDWDRALLDRLGIPADLLPGIVTPGTVIGPVTAEIAGRIGKSVPVVAVGSHDTASAVAAIPMPDQGAAYISCGTWGLVGVETQEPIVTDAAREANFTHERGVDGTYRFLHNVTGLWLLSESVRAWESEDAASIDLPSLLRDSTAVAAEVPLFDANDPSLSAPGDMPRRIAAVIEAQGDAAPTDRAAFTRCIVESIAQAFAEAVDRAGELSGRQLDTIYLVGGGSLNTLLCQATADRSGRPVLAGPVEATALGNVLVQARALAGGQGRLSALRELVAHTHRPERFDPRPAK